MKSRATTTALLFVLMGTGYLAAQQPGTLDTSFGVDGMVRNSFEWPNKRVYEGHAIVAAPDGKIVAAGISDDGGALVRYHPNGSIDTLSDFNFTGFSLIGGALIFNGGTYNCLNDLTIDDSKFYDVALQPDGKIVIIGLSTVVNNNDRYTLLRQNPDGSFDQTFGVCNYGVVFGEKEIGHSVAIQPDGKILVSGDGFVARHLPDGHIDTSFANNGLAAIPIAANYTMLLQPDDKILVVGWAGPSTYNFAMARFTPDGILDTSFGLDGVVTADVTSQNDVANSIEILPDGKVLAVGTSGDAISVARFKENGDPDLSYGENGVATFEQPGKRLVAYASTLQPNGKLVVAGYQTSNVQGDVDNSFLLARLTSNGQLDSGFGDGGIVLTNPSPKEDRLTDVNLQPDGKIIVTGFVGRQYTPGNEFSWGREFTVARYFSGLSVDVSETYTDSQAIVLSPNPTKDILNVQLFNPSFGSKASVRVFNSQGIAIQSMEVNKGSDKLSINVQDLPPGMYFLQYLEGGEVKAAERFVVQR